LVRIIKKLRPKPPDQKATDDQLAALQDLFSGQPPEKPPLTQEQRERERQHALDSLFTGLERKQMGVAKSESLNRAKVIQKRHREIDPLEIEAANQEKAFLVRRHRREEKMAAIAREAGNARLARSLQVELERFSKSLAGGVFGALQSACFL
jgi:hypothetical protein